MRRVQLGLQKTSLTAVPTDPASNVALLDVRHAAYPEMVDDTWVTGNKPSRWKVGWAEYISMMLMLSMYAAAITPLIRRSSSTVYFPGDSDPASAIMQYIALAITVAWAGLRFRHFQSMLRPMLPYIAIIVLCFASVTWSSYPFQSLRRCVTLTVCILYGMYLFDRLGFRALLDLYTQTAVILAILSILLYVAVPSLGRGGGEGYENALTGVFAAKNATGMMMLLAIAGVLMEGLQQKAGRRLVAIAIYVLLFGTLVLTRSATSTMICLLCTFAGAWLWLRSPKWKLAYKAALVGAGTVLLFTILFWPEQVFLLMGRDATLTGRVPLWNEALILIAKRPWFGYGYSGFWINDSPDVQYLWKVIGWSAPNAHDGYIDILLQLGIVGLAMYLYMWAKIISQALLYAKMFHSAVWILLFMMVNVLLNINEGPLPYPDEFTLLIPGALVSLHRMGYVRAAWFRSMHRRRTIGFASMRGNPLAPVAYCDERQSV